MFTRMKLENFKSWQALDIEMAPLTLLFGTNSSGKSSILQSILLIWQTIIKTRWLAINFGGTASDFTDVGGFREMVFEHNLENTVRINIEPSFDLRMWQAKNDVEYSVDEGINTFTINDDGILSYHYLGPLRLYPKRSYLWSGVAPYTIEPDGENTIAALIESTRRDNQLLDNVSKWLIKSGLVGGFKVNPLDKDNRFYETQVEIGNAISNLLDVGFGISQVLPVITLLYFAPRHSIVLLEQPELHLHPRAQAHLADLMLHVAQERKLQLIVESHSEHLLRRLQRRIAEEDHEFANPDNIKMYFCDMGDNGSTIQSVGVDEYGQIQNWPDKFFGDITGDLEAMTMAALKRSLNGKN
ncbi:MAG: DUF3696 domain-containing protein [Anaerolineae bacterium]|nr:DUF3696 domain-containing protein [Anaerolineae bacterium]MDQ7033436.1 DUF3696 domain-containing protein [Anaerolineae bacterium]